MKKLELRSNQQGFAALLVAMVIITVVALITVGFAQLMRNEVNQAVNRSLSQQAFYAAESGINDAAKALSLDQTLVKDTCPPLTAAQASGSAAKQFLRNNTLNGTNSEWTCLLIDSSPGSLEYGNVDRLSPTTFNVSAVDAAGVPKPFNTLTVYWQDSSSSITNFRPISGAATNTAFPPAGGGGSSATNWGNSTGVLRMTMTNTLPPYTRQSLKDNTFTTFLYPARESVSGSNSVAYSTAPSDQGKIVDGRCNTANTAPPTSAPRYCSVTFTGIATSELLITLRSIYSDSSAFIIGDTTTQLVGAQSLVDATGRSQNVLKRVQVRIPSKGRYYLPGFTVESAGGVCKQLTLKPNGGSTDTCTY